MMILRVDFSPQDRYQFANGKGKAFLAATILYGWTSCSAVSGTMRHFVQLCLCLTIKRLNHPELTQKKKKSGKEHFSNKKRYGRA